LKFCLEAEIWFFSKPGKAVNKVHKIGVLIFLGKAMTSKAAAVIIRTSQAKKKILFAALRQNFKNLLGNFFGINMKSLYAKFHLFSFKTEGGV